MRTAFVFCCALLATSICVANDHAVVLVYHHVSTETPALTSVAPEVFDNHLDYLDENDFNVWPLGRVLDALHTAKEIPPNTVAITFDDAYESVYTAAFPRLRQRGWPFTLFVNTEAIDRGYKNYLSWDRIRELAAAGIEIGNHSHGHAHLVRRQDGESESQWRHRVTTDIETAANRLQSETGTETKLFAYPYGEYSDELKAIIASMGYYGIAQHSGAVGHGSDFLAVPRYPMSTGYSSMERFAISVASRPLPVRSVVSDEPDALRNRVGKLQLTLESGDYRAQQLACFNASGSRLQIDKQSDQPLRVLIRLPTEQSAGRNKINCTAPAARESDVYYWYSYQWLVKNPDGSWYRE